MNLQNLTLTVAWYALHTLLVREVGGHTDSMDWLFVTVDDVTAVGKQAVMVVNSELLELTLSSKSGKSKSTFQPTDIITTVKI